MSAKESNTEQKEIKETPPLKDEIVETRHTAVINGREIAYTVTAGTMVLQEEEKEDEDTRKPKAAVFFIAYTKEGEEVAGRPITFSFNGGPGSSSVWLHLGVLGPRRVPVEQEGDVGGQCRPLPPPYRLVDNEHSLLDVTDLVFIDPVSTGYSRAAPREKIKQFHNFKKDIESVGEFIRLYTTRARRWTSPKFLIGESYGTTRAAGLSGHLQDRHGLYLNGIMLVSSILNFQTADFHPGNDLPYPLFLPTYTATAWYHRRLDDALQQDLRQTLDEVEAFAGGEYTLALMKGAKLTADERAHIVQKLTRYTGLSADYIERANLRIEIHRFVKELLRDERRTVGRLDSRFTGIDRDAAGEQYDYDPSYAVIQGPYTATLNDYVRGELQFESDLPYEILTGRVWPWKFEQHENQYVDVADTLRDAMSKNPFLKIFVANGYFDLATPYFATEYTFNHLGLDPDRQQNIAMAYYPAGHMMYIHDPSLAQLKVDLAAFVASAVPNQ
jgi:carboxypeptidase C (cathepsin A)